MYLSYVCNLIDSQTHNRDDSQYEKYWLVSGMQFILTTSTGTLKSFTIFSYLSYWLDTFLQSKKGVWIKLPIFLVSLV